MSATIEDKLESIGDGNFKSVESHKSVMLSETDIDFYDNFDLQFHLSGGREFESEETENGGQTINTKPNPTIGVKKIDESIHFIAHIPTSKPIIISHTVGYISDGDSIQDIIDLNVLLLDDGYTGIETLSEFEGHTDDDGSQTELCDMLVKSVETVLPEDVSVVLPPAKMV